MFGYPQFFSRLSQICVLLLLAGVSHGAPVILRMHHDMPVDSALHRGAEVFKKMVEQETKGYYRVDLYPSNALGDDLEAVQQMQIGAIHAAPIPSAKLSNLAPTLQILDLPYLFDGPAAADRFMEGRAGSLLLRSLERRGLSGAGFWESGFKQLTCKNILQRGKALAGANVRVMESPILAAQFHAIGARPVTVSFSETYIALQQGMVDCQENPIVSIAKMRFNEVQNELWLSRHGYLGYVFLFSQRWLAQQPVAMQRLLKDVARRAARVQRGIARTEEAEYLRQVLEGGAIKVYRNPELEQQMRFSMRSIYPRFRRQLGVETFDAVLAAAREGQP